VASTGNVALSSQADGVCSFRAKAPAAPWTWKRFQVPGFRKPVSQLPPPGPRG